MRSRFQYQGIDEERRFDIINLSNYAIILGTPWMYQRQARWIEEIPLVGFEVRYILETENGLEDALSRMYSNDVPGTVHAHSNCTYHDVGNGDFEVSGDLPILVGCEAHAVVHRHPRKIIPSAGTGCHETSRRFMARVHDNFVLRGPVE